MDLNRIEDITFVIMILLLAINLCGLPVKRLKIMILLLVIYLCTLAVFAWVITYKYFI